MWLWTEAYTATYAQCDAADDSGGPEFGFDVDDIKPVGVIVAAALSLLAAGKSLKASKAITAAKLSKPEWFYEDISLKACPPYYPLSAKSRAGLRANLFVKFPGVRRSAAYLKFYHKR